MPPMIPGAPRFAVAGLISSALFWFVLMDIPKLKEIIGLGAIFASVLLIDLAEYRKELSRPMAQTPGAK